MLWLQLCNCMFHACAESGHSPGFSDHGLSMERILEWVAISSPGDLPDPGIEPVCLLHWQADSLPLSCHLRSTNCTFNGYKFFIRYWCPQEYFISMKIWIWFKNFTLSSVLADFELINIKLFLLSVKTTPKEDY